MRVSLLTSACNENAVRHTLIGACLQLWGQGSTADAEAPLKPGQEVSSPEQRSAREHKASPSKPAQAQQSAEAEPLADPPAGTAGQKQSSPAAAKELTEAQDVPSQRQSGDSASGSGS